MRVVNVESFTRRVFIVDSLPLCLDRGNGNRLPQFQLGSGPTLVKIVLSMRGMKEEGGGEDLVGFVCLLVVFLAFSPSILVGNSKR